MATARSPRPTEVFLLHERFDIEWLTEDQWVERKYDEGWSGVTFAEDGLIAVRATVGKKESRLQEVLLHEVLHAVWDSVKLNHADYPGPSDDTAQREAHEEMIIGTQAPPLLFVLKRNPGLYKYLMSDGDHRRR